MPNNKLFTVIFLFSTSYTISSEAELLAEKLINARRKNSRSENMLKNVGEHGLNTASAIVTNAGKQYTEEKITRWFDNCPTTTEAIKRFNDATVHLGNQSDLVQKQLDQKEKSINKKITQIRKNQDLTPTAKQNKIALLEKELDDFIDASDQKIDSLIEQAAVLQEEFNKLTSTKLITSNNIAKNPTPSEEEQPTSVNQTVSSNTDDRTKSNPSNIDKPASEEENEESKNTEVKKQGLIAKISSAIIPACVGSFNFIAENCGPKTAATWLAANSSFFKDKEALVTNTLTTAGTAVVLVALYKAIQIFTSQEDDEDDSLDIFSENFDVNSRRK